MRRIFTFIAAASLCLPLAAEEWAPAGDKIKTKWADEVNPAKVLPEYPRPQMVRGSWKNLNGLWDYAITSSDATDFKAEGKILVPFAVESSLSGVGRTVTEQQALWYQKTVSIPSQWRGRDILLHFGAVDWKAEVWVNGSKAGEHTGAYTPFSFNITPYLKAGKANIRIRVWDPQDTEWIPRGKQTLSPEGAGIWYTALTGIWQTVWMEAVPKTRVESYEVVSDVDASNISVNVKTSGMKEGDKIKVELIDGGVGYSAETPGEKVLASLLAENGRTTIAVPDLKTWSPDSPYLYGLRFSILRKGKVIDSVNGYTAVRKISRLEARTSDGNKYFFLALNNKPLFHYGPLDQGWWPDGLYTAPTDEALKYDIVKTREWGFNMIRKHIKVEPARWFYWCDVLGVMVWQDMPCIGDHSFARHKGGPGHRSDETVKIQRNKWSTNAPERGTECDVPQQWKDNYYKEWSEIIDAVKVFQCVTVWVPFNEAWGQFDTKKVVEFTRTQDSTRLINEASGGNYRAAGDILDVHHYPTPAMHCYDKDKVNVLGEYGGIGCVENGHIWREGRNWGYNGVKPDHKAVTDTYVDFTNMLKVFVRTGCSAAVYTQTTDVEGEVNGLMTYDRKVVKIEEGRVREANLSVIESMAK